MSKNEVSLSIAELKGLKFLCHYYEHNQTGCIALKIRVNPEIIKSLMAKDLMFKTDKGYFPSTKGQELINTQNPSS